MRTGHETLGARLRAERAGITLDAVAQSTKVQRTLLVGLENNDLSRVSRRKRLAGRQTSRRGRGVSEPRDVTLTFPSTEPTRPARTSSVPQRFA